MWVQIECLIKPRLQAAMSSSRCWFLETATVVRLQKIEVQFAKEKKTPPLAWIPTSTCDLSDPWNSVCSPTRRTVHIGSPVQHNTAIVAEFYCCKKRLDNHLKYWYLSKACTSHTWVMCVEGPLARLVMKKSKNHPHCGKLGSFILPHHQSC